MKKKFVKPQTAVVEMKSAQTILAGSTVTVGTSDEVINDLGTGSVGARVSRFRTWALGKMDF